MKSLIITIITLFTFNLNAQFMKTPQDAVTGLFIATDQKNWQQVAHTFYKEVVLDYASMNGNPATKLTPEQIVAAWKTILPGFEHTHHQIGNYITKIEGQKASFFCYGTATHFLPDEKGNLWTVVGSYDFELIQLENKEWKITSMKFNYKYQDGNTSLPEKAMKNSKP